MIWGDFLQARFGHGAFRAWCAALSASVFLIGAPPAAAQNVDSETGTARTVIVSRLSLVKVADLNFGAVLPSTTAGTIVLGIDNSRTATGGVQAVGGGAHAARFAGYGYNGQLLQISVNANAPVMTRVGGTQTMTFDTFVVSSDPVTTISATPRLFQIASANGMFQFAVGATLRVRANQTPGQYHGNFNVTVNYQ